MLRAVAAVIIAAAVVRGVGMMRSAPVEPAGLGNAQQIREMLRLPSDHRFLRLLATYPLPQGPAVLWLDSTQSVTAIVPDATGRLRVSHDWTTAAELTTEKVTASDLAGIDPSGWPALPPQFDRLSVRRWDPNAAVFITVGPDGQPGIAGIDDDGDGVVDDLGELGATGSDDVVVAPDQPGYAKAAAGEIVARVISRGALVELDDDLVLPSPEADAAADHVTEVWLEFSGAAAVAPVRFCLRLD